MYLKRTRIIQGSILVALASLIIFSVSCTTTVVKETEYTPGGEVTYSKEQVDNDTVYELRRVFANRRIEGVGIFENENEGLARSSAINLAINDLASKVQVETRSNSVIYNRNDVREIVETQVHALVQGYRIESEGYDPNSIKYRVRISVEGEQLVREIEKRLVR